MSLKHENEIDMEQVAAFLQDAVAKVKMEEDPEVLTALKKVYKQNVPFTLRMYVAAYLLKQIKMNSGRFTSRRNREDVRRDGKENKNDRRESRAAARSEDREPRRQPSERSRNTDRPAERPVEARERGPRVQIDPELATTIFIGIGRNRRVYPRDLVGLLVSVAGLDREKIGDIRVLANYSFIQLFTDDAAKAISILNGYDYRGRKLSVSYSRQKDDEDISVSSEGAIDVDAEPVPDVPNTSSPVIESSVSIQADTVAQQAAFAAAQESTRVQSDAAIAAARAPRSSSSDVAEAAPAEENN
jgi:hypothetical protein